MAIIEVNKDNFEEEVLKSDKKVLVDFWADWCGPCKMLSPVIDKLAEELEDVKVCKVNVDTEPTISIEYNIMSIPTLLVFENGVEVNRSVGLVSKEEVLELLK
ncbi:thioredoxin [uncultured Eubacterium sp.]|uniref:thioredoxin n=1 Tax=uncultured Eubacterium sp. TaxID=165185 RepID=UPI002676CA0B|nr:thioredoxin [uncultured Eubacterium sp.]